MVCSRPIVSCESMSEGCAGSASDAGSPEGLAGSASSDEGLAGSASSDASAASEGRGLQREVHESAATTDVYLLVAGCGALFPTWSPSKTRTPPPRGTSRTLLGAVEARWRFSATPSGSEEECMWDLACRRLQASTASGCIFYDVLRPLALKEPAALEDVGALLPHQILERFGARPSTWADGGDIDEGTFGDMSSTLMQRGSGRVYIAVVTSALAQAILKRQWGILHAFMLTRRVHPSRTLGPLKKAHSPELSQLRKMCVQRWQTGRGSALEHQRRRLGEHTPVQTVLQWLDATRHLKSLRHKDDTAEAFAALMADTNEEQARLVRQIPSCTSETLRKARVRLDCVAMLIVRAFMAMLTPDSVSLHLFTDESPQKRGRMLLASSMDVCHRTHEMRMLLPNVCLARGCLGMLGKLAGLVWQLFLVLGMTRLRAFCDAVLSVTTDMGTERLLATADDHLQLLLRHFGCPEKLLPPHVGGKLFRFALHIRGWRHTWDLIGCKRNK